MRWRPRGAALASAVAATAVLSACTAGLAGPYQYYNGTGLHDATVAEASGTWRSVEETQLTLRPDGTAALRLLDGQDFDFDDAWRVTGSGTWKLTDGSGGQEIELSMTTRTAAGTRVTTPAPTASPTAPSTYTWRFYVDRDTHRKLVLFFFYGDPDAGNTYLMTRAAAR
ncbi:hypothetical protein [Streptomyces sp. Root1310]|uniref:hypothetical protein n=1 Tax=Streptomyces sp. Root1310 TaxID=1736452 RepID=UPI00070A5EE6|nr:hypothetical protein [Streptomyces sp. Root1310]KQX70795.1 hypothetical protein ASD48_10145 [Streptomyces sp. Root1310]